MKDPIFFIKHINDSISNIEEFSKNFSKEDFLKDRKTQGAVIREIEIIGEAVKNLPEDFKNENLKIPWKSISGMRDKLIHHYFGVDLEKVWEVVEREIPLFKKEIKLILSRT
jgi:uncharacterized protein with HEPN domain